MDIDGSYKRRRSCSPVCEPETSHSSSMSQEALEMETTVPSPVMFLECSGSSAGGSVPTTPTSPKQARRPKHNKKKTTPHNIGSETESDSEEDEAAQAVIPRVFRAIMETPEDVGPIIESPPPLPPPLSPPPTVSAAPLHPTWTGPLEPCAFLDFKWSPFPNPRIPSCLRRESFSNSNVGPTAPYTDPYDIFIDIWDRQIMDHIASETNKYAQQLAQQLFASNKLGPSSRISDWKDTTADELYVFFAMTLAMGVVAKGRVVDYWNSNASIFTTPGFRVYMSVRRYQLLCRCLHFRDNKDMCTLNLSASEAKIYKIQPILDHLNGRFQSMYNLQQNIALDESLLQWKGWLDINQFIPTKTAATGIKTYEVCESQTGYLWRFVVHAYKRTETAGPESDPLQAYIPSLVLKLLRGLERRGHTVWMDNFYNSPALARKLKSLGFDCAGTLRTNRQFVPRELTNLTKADMRPGEVVGFTSGDVDVMAWRDQNRVGMISTYHGDHFAQLRGITKPTLIHDYNQMMGGVDKKDQMLAAFPVERKRTRIWYKKLFRRLLNVSVLNAYIISKHFNPIDHRSFRIALTEAVLARHAPLAPPALVAQSMRANDFRAHKRVYSASEHYLMEFELKENQKSRNRRVCAACKKRVTTYCVGCDKAVCMTNCFKTIHS